MIRRPAARSALPVSVMSTTQSTMSGTFASVAPYDKRMSASTPLLGEELAGQHRVLARHADPGGQVGHAGVLGVVGNGHDDLDRVAGRLGVAQLAERDHVGLGLLHPVTARDAEVEQSVGHVRGDLLGTQDAHALDPRIVDRRPCR